MDRESIFRRCHLLVCSLFGHSYILFLDRNLIFDTIKSAVDRGYRTFYVGRHGEFDKLALQICKEIKNKYCPDMKIYLVFTSMTDMVRNKSGLCNMDCLYEIENVHYKRRITFTNQRMAECCDLVICYADEEVVDSGAARAVRYARKIGKEVINLFKKRRP